ncbi:MAG: peptide ABC transporter substrate-binding protein, partial [Verrucomicrobiota bacterium]
QFPEERAFQDGLVHVTYVLPSNLIEWYREERPEVFRSEPYAGIYFYRCNLAKKPLDDVRVRKALSLSIDREAIVKNITMGGQLPASGFVPPTEGGYVAPEVVSFDPARARALLAEAGYPDGDGFPAIELMYNTSEAHRPIAEAIQSMWKKELGVETIRLNNQEWKAFQQTIFEEKYEIGRAGWIADYVDPTTFLDMWRTGDSNNNTSWSSPKYDRLLQEAALEADPEARRKKLFAAEEVLLEEMPVIPLYWYTRTYAIHPAVKHWNPLLLDKRDYKFIELQP